MINLYNKSKDYMKPFGVIFHYSDGHKSGFSNINIALCAYLTKKQRKYVENLKKEIEKN